MSTAEQWKGRVLILGGASCVWDDLYELEYEILGGQQWPGTVIAVNDVGCVFTGDLDHWVSLHGEKFSAWLEERERLGRSVDSITLWTRRGKDVYADHALYPWAGGSSGMLAVQTAVEELQAKRVVLVGMPMTKTRHFQESIEHTTGHAWLSAIAHWRPWPEQVHLFGEVTRSLSGKTAELLGKPTRSWILG